MTGLRTTGFVDEGRDVVVVGVRESIGPVDEVVAATGFRPDISVTRELRLALDPAVESPVALAPMIDPNHHSCGTVRSHGEAELDHPEKGFYVGDMKSYCRAPIFLMLTGYEQACSIVAALARDWEPARNLELKLPETRVCSAGGISSDPDAGCCATWEPSSASPQLVSLLSKAGGAARVTEVEQNTSCCA